MVCEKFPHTVKPVEENPFFIIRRAVKEARPIRFKALKVGSAYVLAYRIGEDVYNAVVGPGYSSKSYDNWADAFEGLVSLLKENVGAKVEVAEVEATEYVLHVEEVEKDGGLATTHEERLVEWGDCSVSLGEDEEIVAEGP